MEIGQIFTLFTFVALVPLLCSGETCLSPASQSNVYTTSEAAMSSETVVIVEFSVACKNNIQNMNLYAEFDGHVIPATRLLGEDKYQVSFSEEHKKLPAGTYSMPIYDEEGYSDLRKAQRNGESTEAIKKLFSVSIVHKGASTGPSVQSEAVATAVAVIVCYLAYSAKANLQS